MNWEHKHLDEFVTFQRGFDLPREHFVNGGVPVYGSTSILGYHNISKVKAPGVITGRSGTLGKFQFATTDFWPHNTSLWVKDFKGNIPKFAFYLMQCLDFSLFNSGGAVPTLNRNVLKGFMVDIPPIPTQNKIVSVLTAYDDLIQINLRHIQLLEEISQITYEEWFIKYKITGRKLKIQKETGLPLGWERIKIGDILSKVKTMIKINNSDFKESGKIPIIDQSRDFIAGYTNDTRALNENDLPIIVFGDHTRILKFINFPFARGADGTQLLISNNKRMPQHLFYNALKNVDLSNYHYARHFKFLKEIEIVLPEESIAIQFEEYSKPIFDLITNLRNQNRLLKEARDILLPRYMTGMIEIIT